MKQALPHVKSLILSTVTAISLLAGSSASGQTWKFIAVGDTRSSTSGDAINTVVVPELVDEIVAQGVDFVIIPGDLVYSGSLANFQTWRNAMATVYQKGVKVYPILGNHDANAPASFIEVFGADLPDNGPSGEVNRTYSFTHNNALVIGLDQYVATHRVNQPWLDAQLANNTLPHVFVFGHEPAFKANHLDCLDDYPIQRDAFWNSLKNYGATAYFCGHDHFYDHLRVDDNDGDPYNDVHQLIVGGGGAPLYSAYARDGANAPWSLAEVYHENQFGYTLVEVNGATVTMTYYHRAGVGTYLPTADVWTYTVSTGPTPPPAPTGLTTIAGDTHVDLNWNAVPAATYNLYRADGTPSGTWAQLAGGLTSTTFTDQSVVNGSTYYYAVSAAILEVESAKSAYVSATPQGLPGPFTLTATSGKRSVTLTWTASTGASSYTVKRATTSNGPYTVLKTGVTALKYADSKTRGITTYYYLVTAVNGAGETQSNETTPTPATRLGSSRTVQRAAAFAQP